CRLQPLLTHRARENDGLRGQAAPSSPAQAEAEERRSCATPTCLGIAAHLRWPEQKMSLACRWLRTEQRIAQFSHDRIKRTNEDDVPVSRARLIFSNPASTVQQVDDERPTFQRGPRSLVTETNDLGRHLCQMADAHRAVIGQAAKNAGGE